MSLSQAFDPRPEYSHPTIPTATTHEMLSQDHKNSFPHSYAHSTMTWTPPHPSPQQHNQLGARGNGANSTRRSARYLCSLAATPSSDHPEDLKSPVTSPARQPNKPSTSSYVLKLKVFLLENGNKLILQLERNILGTPKRLFSFTC